MRGGTCNQSEGETVTRPVYAMMQGMTGVRTMKHLHLMAALCLGLLTASAQAQSLPSMIHADQAVEQSVASPDAVLEMGWIWMDVCGSGSDGNRGFLNSYENYRDRRSLNVRIDPMVRIALSGRLGDDPIDALLGRRIRVRGPVRQVWINIYRDGVQSGHYFQTHLVLQSATDLEIIERAEDDPPSSCDTIIS